MNCEVSSALTFGHSWQQRYSIQQNIRTDDERIDARHRSDQLLLISMTKSLINCQEMWGIRCSVAAVSNLADLWYLSRSLTTTSWAYRSSSSSVCSSSCPVRWPTNFERFSVTTAEMRHTRSIAYRCSDTLNHGTGRRTMSHRVACLLMLNIWNSYLNITYLYR